MSSVDFVVARVAVIVCVVMWLWWDYDVYRLKNEKTAAVEAQVESCKNDKKITEEIANETQNRISDLRQQLDNIKRVQPSRCVPIVTPSASRNNETAPDNKLSKQDGIHSSTLYDFAAEAEGEAGIPLDQCQKFICDTWEKNGQKLSYPVCN